MNYTYTICITLHEYTLPNCNNVYDQTRVILYVQPYKGLESRMNRVRGLLNGQENIGSEIKFINIRIHDH